MTTEEQGSGQFDAGAFVAEGIEAAGGEEAINKALDIDPESAEETAQHEPAGVMSQKKKDSDEETQQTGQKGDDTTDAAKAALDSIGDDDDEQSQEDTESVIANLLPQAEAKPDETKPADEQRVPLSELVKQRQRAQEAERRLAELEAKATAPTGEQPGKQEKSPLDKWIEENPDDAEISPPPAIVMVQQRQWDEARARQMAEAHQKAQDEARQAAEAEAQRISAQQTLRTKAETSEAAFKKAHPDYVDVTKAFVVNRQLTPEELQDISKADNPAQKLYEVCKAKRDSLAAALGIRIEEEPASNAPGAQKKSTGDTGEGDEMTDEDIFNEVYLGALNDKSE